MSTTSRQRTPPSSPRIGCQRLINPVAFDQVVSLYLGVFYHRTYNAEVHFRTHPRCQALANHIGNMVRARRITGLMFRTLSAKNSWREGQSFRDISQDQFFRRELAT